MKNILCSLVIIILCFPAFSQETPGITPTTPAKKTPVAKLPQNYVFIQPFHFFVNQFKVSYEKMYQKNKKSFMGTAGLYLKNSQEVLLTGEAKEYLSSGYNIEIQNRFFLLSNVTQHQTMTTTYNSHLLFYTAPFAKFNHYNIQGVDTIVTWVREPNGIEYQLIVNEEYADKINSFSGGVVFGFKWVFMDKLALDLHAGGGAKFSDISYGATSVTNRNDYNQTPFSKGYTGIFPTMNAQIGIAF